MTVTVIFPHTPQTFVMIAVALCTLYGACGKTPALIRLGRAFLPTTVLTILLLLATSIGWGDLRYLLPFWGSGPAALMHGSVGLTGLFSPLPLFLLIAVRPLHDRSRLWRSGTIAIGGVCLLITAITIIFLKAYPLPFGSSITYPLWNMAEMTLGGRFFERIEGIWVFVWFYCTVYYLAVLIHTAALAYTNAFGIANHRIAVLPLVTMSITIALFPPDQGRTIAWHAAILLPGVGIGSILPFAFSLFKREQPLAGR